MKNWKDKSMIERIQEILAHRYHISESSAVGEAIATVIFNRNSKLVGECDTYEEARKAINPTIVQDGIKHVIEIANSFMPWLR